MMNKINIGDRVEIVRKDIKSLVHRPQVFGRVTNINGAYIMVKPMWCNWKIELYPNEIKK